MKFTVDVDCTPEEARAFLGLPDMKPIHDMYLQAVTDTMSGQTNLEQMERMFRGLSPLGDAGMKLFLQHSWTSASTRPAAVVRCRRRRTDGVGRVESPDTIFALSSGAPPAAIGVIRISGPRARDAAAALITAPLPEARQARFRRLIDPETRELLDEVRAGLVSRLGQRDRRGYGRVAGPWFARRDPVDRGGTSPSPRRAHGRSVGVHPPRLPQRQDRPRQDRRPCRPYPRRDVSSASGRDGDDGRRVVAEDRGMGSKALAMSAKVEAVLNFSDEGDVDEAAVRSKLSSEMTALAQELAADLARPTAGALKDGVRVVIAGHPMRANPHCSMRGGARQRRRCRPWRYDARCGHCRWRWAVFPSCSRIRRACVRRAVTRSKLHWHGARSCDAGGGGHRPVARAWRRIALRCRGTHDGACQSGP